MESHGVFQCVCVCVCCLCLVLPLWGDDDDETATLHTASASLMWRASCLTSCLRVCLLLTCWINLYCHRGLNGSRTCKWKLSFRLCDSAGDEQVYRRQIWILWKNGRKFCSPSSSSFKTCQCFTLRVLISFCKSSLPIFWTLLEAIMEVFLSLLLNCWYTCLLSLPCCYSGWGVMRCIQRCYCTWGVAVQWFWIGFTVASALRPKFSVY